MYAGEQFKKAQLESAYISNYVVIHVAPSHPYWFHCAGLIIRPKSFERGESHPKPQLESGATKPRKRRGKLKDSSSGMFG